LFARDFPVALEFYERLFAGENPAEALRQAKLALIQQRDLRRGAYLQGTPHRTAPPLPWSHPASSLFRMR
jgi:CHAT domain-containing protein